MTTPPTPPAHSAQPAQPQLESNNWNPLSSKPTLDAPAFALSIGVIGTLESAIGFVIQNPLHSARLNLDFKQLAILYAAWSISSLIGFLMISNTFIKRWATIWGEPTQSPRWMKTLGRVFLTSPLLSIWATIFTFMYSRQGTVFRQDEKRSVIAATALGSLVIFHIGFLGYRMVNSEIKMSHGYFVLNNDIDPRESLRKVASYAKEEYWIPGPAFQIHVYPYFSPISKLVISLYGDFVRSHTLEVAVEAKPEVYCNEVPTYVGQNVPNCFLTRYREMGRLRAFVSPATGVIFETLYRKSLKDLTANSPMDAFAKSAITVENLVTLLEPGELVYDRQQFLHPVGLLSFYGSPELPAIAIGQDTQHFALSTRLLPMILPQIQKLSKSLDGMKGALSPQEELATKATLQSMEHRLKSLEADPLALHRKPGSP